MELLNDQQRLILPESSFLPFKRSIRSHSFKWEKKIQESETGINGAVIQKTDKSRETEILRQSRQARELIRQMLTDAKIGL